MQCSWCVNVSRFADFIGFAGAILLAYPFLTEQSLRDTLLLLSSMAIPDERDRQAVDASREAMVADISNKSRKELRLAWIGAGLIAVSFIVKFAISFV
jgi:hypothetical protein